MRHLYLFLFLSLVAQCGRCADFEGTNAGSDAGIFVQAMQRGQFDAAASTFDYARAPFSNVRHDLAKHLEMMTLELGGFAGALRVNTMPQVVTAVLEISAIRPASLKPQLVVSNVVYFEAKSPRDGTVYYQVHLIEADAGWRVAKLQVHLQAANGRAYDRVKELLRKMKSGPDVALGQSGWNGPCHEGAST